MSLVYSDLERQILEKSHAVVPFSMTKPEFEQAIQTFVKFLALPLEVKEPLYFQLYPGERGGEVGYKRYLRNEGKTDNREYVHYHSLAEERFTEQRKVIPEFDALLQVMKHIHDTGVATLKEIFTSFDGQYPGLYQKFFPDTGGRGDFFLRFLKYDRAQPGEFLAKGHYDRGACTLALAESAPGLRMGIDDAHLMEVAHREGEALFMPALKFASISEEKFVPTWHDVIQKSDDAYSEDIARWAIVLFGDTIDRVHITYEDAHTPKRT